MDDDTDETRLVAGLFLLNEDSDNKKNHKIKTPYNLLLLMGSVKCGQCRVQDGEG